MYNNFDILIAEVNRKCQKLSNKIFAYSNKSSETASPMYAYNSLTEIVQKPATYKKSKGFVTLV